MESPYEQGLKQIAPPGIRPREIRLERWEAWARGDKANEAKADQKAEASKVGAK